MATVDVDLAFSSSDELHEIEEATKSTTQAPAKSKGKAKAKPRTKTQSKSGLTIGTKKRKNRSEVHDYFTVLEEGTYPKPEDDDYKRGQCKGCAKILICDGRYGTTNLKRHISSCVKLHGQSDMRQMLLSSSMGGDMSLRDRKFDNGVYREKLAKMVVRHEFPFLIVEYEGIREVLDYLYPDVQHISRNTCRADAFKLYEKNKHRIKELLDSCPGRISITSDFWTSMTSDAYMCITAHFIDNDWKLHDFILCFSCFPPPHNGTLISEMFSKLLGESGWNIEHKLMTITLDNASNNDTFVDSYMTKLVSQDALLWRGSFFRVRCAAHVINLIVKSGLEDLHEVIQKVRQSVKYVKGSPSRIVKFNEAARDKKIVCTIKLKHDIVTRWNSIYLMLESALYYQSVFSHLAIIDKNYPFCPSPDEWKKVDFFCKFFKFYYELTKLFSGSTYPTSNLFFHGVWKIQYQLLEEAKNPDPFVGLMVERMQSKFDSYWHESNLVLATAAVLDPRYKMKLVEYAYGKIYGIVEGTVKARMVRDALYALFDEYKLKDSSNSDAEGIQAQEGAHHKSSKDGTGFYEYDDDFDSYVMQESAFEDKSELDAYLQEKCIDRKQEFDILLWWKLAQHRYPCLSKLARDILTIPITSVASESAFSLGGRILKPSRCSLSPEAVEVLVCGRNWLFGLKEEDEGHVDALTWKSLSLDLSGGTSQQASNEPASID